MSYRIVVLTSDKYSWSAIPYAWLLRKYWPKHPDVLVAGYTPPRFRLPPRFEFHSIGNFADYPLERWSDGVIKLLHDIDDEVFILTLEDMWITRPVYREVVDMAYGYMQQFEYVARLDLTGDRLHSRGPNGETPPLYGKLGHVNLIWSVPEWPYHMSTMPAFWRKKHLLRMLVPGETPWETEIAGSSRLAAITRDLNTGAIVLGTDAWPIHNTLAFRGGDPTSTLLNELNPPLPEDVEEMKSLGILPDDSKESE